MMRILTPSAPADEPEVVELGHLILHEGRRVPELGAAVLVVTRAHGHHRAVADLAEGHHLERHRQSLVRAPVRRQLTAEEVRGTCEWREFNV